jgi:integrase
MARTIRDAKLETRAARDRLPAGRNPHFKTLVPGKLHLGYRRKRKDLPGQWLVRRYIGGQRYRIAALGVADDFQDDAMTFAEAQRAALASKAPTTTGAPTVAMAIAEYIAWLKTHRATGKEAEQRAAKLILPQLGRIKVADLTTVALNHWRDELAASPALTRSPVNGAQNYKAAPATAETRRARRATVNRTIGILKAALNKAFHDGLVSEDVAWRRFKPFERVHAARPGYLTLEQSKRLINAADHDSGFRDLVHAALLTGARRSELYALRVRDFHRGKLAIHRSKSGRPRDIVLTGEGEAFFEQLCAGRDPEATLLRPCAPRFMRQACVRAKIKPMGFHQLRHTWASLAVMGGMPLMVVARNMGHASTAMCEKHYGHLTASYIDDAIKAAAPKFGVVAKTNVRSLRR